MDRTYEAGRFLRRRGNLRVRRERRLRILGRGVVRTLALGAIVLLAAWGARSAYRWLVTTPSLAVTRLEVSGQQEAEVATLEALAAGALEQNLFALDLDQVAANVRTHPWVRSVVVQRRVPDTLVIQVEERRPCALAVLDGEVFLLDARGNRIDRFGPRYSRWSLPAFRGLEGLEPLMRIRRCRLAAAHLEELRADYPGFASRLAEVDLSNPQFTVLSFEGGEERLRVAPDDWDRNLDSYRALRTQIFRQHGSLRHVDLRWRGRVVAMPEAGGSG